jgi:hypothetical protein
MGIDSTPSLTEALWKCRAVETEENQTTVSLCFHRPWKSLGDSHISTATTTAPYLPNKTRKELTAFRPYFIPSGSFFNEKMLKFLTMKHQHTCRANEHNQCEGK